MQYLVRPVVPGITLAQWIRERRDRGHDLAAADVDLVLGWMEEILQALHCAHQAGLVHRDVKPSNIIFVGGRPKLADIGLVADASDTCSIVGTEGYLPPEGPGTPQADLFALGKVLYEATTGLDRRELPKLPEDLRTWPDASEVFELNEIILKACSYDAKDRYQSAEEMHADLVLLEVGRSVRQKRQADRHWQVLRRSSVWLVLAVVAFALFAIRNRLGPPPTNPEFRKRSTNSFANRQYNIGRSLYQKNTTASTAKAAEYFQAAVNADANFALAQAALAAAWSWGDVGTNRTWALLPRAKENAERALAKDDSLSEAYLALAMHAWILEWDWPKTEKFFKRAINCDPQNPQPHEWYGQFLRAMGQTNEAVRELETAVTINPRSRTGIAFLGRALLSARRYSEAVERMELLDEMQSDSMSLWCLGEALSWGGQIERSITVLARAAELNGSDPVITTVRTEALTKALHEGGEAAFWQKRLEFLRTETSDPMDLAAACASAGQTDEALDLLERAYREHHVFLVWDLKAHPEWDSLRGHPRFKALLKKLRLD
ncbi:MAG TPA: hypothetical protein DCE44_26375 [Verrucomicrobiales bacterium]|nr:hypothetical protein [Verrucomicrobiales bacterium]